MSDYDPIESLREEVNRFLATNTFTPMLVTGFYVQAKVVLAEVDRLKEENEKLTAQLSTGLCSIHQTPEPMRCSTCNKVHWLEQANETRMTMLEEKNEAIARVLSWWDRDGEPCKCGQCAICGLRKAYTL